MLGHWEVFFILLMVLLIFGGKKIPEVARGLGKGLREFKKAKDEVSESFNEALKDTHEPSKTGKDEKSAASSVDKEEKSEENRK